MYYVQQNDSRKMKKKEIRTMSVKDKVKVVVSECVTVTSKVKE